LKYLKRYLTINSVSHRALAFVYSIFAG